MRSKTTLKNATRIVYETDVLPEKVRQSQAAIDSAQLGRRGKDGEVKSGVTERADKGPSQKNVNTFMTSNQTPEFGHAVPIPISLSRSNLAELGDANATGVE